MKTGTQRIYQERIRQMNVEGFTPDDDLKYESGELLDAAICYANAAKQLEKGESHKLVSMDPHHYCNRPWPWEASWWKPSYSASRNLEKAGALIAAEIDRLECVRAREVATTKYLGGIKIEAYDEDGNTFLKNVDVQDRDDKKVVSFGGYCSYYVESLIGSYPFTKPLCIDAAGRNHRGSPVYVKMEDVNKILEPFS